MTKPPENFTLEYPHDYVIKMGDLYFSRRSYRWMNCGSTIGCFARNSLSHNISAFAVMTKNLKSNKDNLPEPPKGFELLENCGEYKLIRGDKFINYKGDKNWETVRDFAGETPNNLMRKHYYDCFYVAIKKNPKPRFETDKAYPWGY